MSTTTAAEFPRKFVTPDADVSDWATDEQYFQKLYDREITSAEEFEQWLIDFSEFESVLGEMRSLRYTAMTCNTADEERKKAFLHIIENIDPQCEPWHFRLQQKLAELADKFDLPKKRYEVLIRSVKNSIEMFREENIPLQTEEAKLEQNYQEITGGITINFRGEEMTPQRVMRFLEETDRDTREEAWRAYTDRYSAEADKLNQLYDEMVTIRRKIAANADFSDFRAYTFKAKERFDYTPEDCLAFHDAIEKVIVPAAAKLAEQRRVKLGLDTLRPWDFEVDPDNNPPLTPFEKVEDLVGGCSDIFNKINPELGAQFDRMSAEKLLDLDSRKGKAPGGYQAVFSERRMPFIFMNAVGSERDVRTLLHEGGHAFHTFATRNEPLIPYRHAPMEMCETASMSMECLGLPYLDRFFGENTGRATKKFFTKIISFFPSMARIDAFQHFVYTNDDAGIEERCDYWAEITKRFSPFVDYTGLEATIRNGWHPVLHIFQSPFYYVEYGIAQLGALQVWLNSKQDFDQAIAFYRNALALGGSRPLPELFEAANIKFDFTENTIRPLMDAVMEEIEKH